MKCIPFDKVQIFYTKMDSTKALALLFLLSLTLDSSIGSENFIGTTAFRKFKRNEFPKISNPNNKYIEMDSTESPPCFTCKKNTSRFPNSIADKIKMLQEIIPSLNHQYQAHASKTKIVPKGSERIAFSQKYNPDLGTENDGFVPVPGPYGTRSGRSREQTLKLSIDNPHKSISTRRPSKRSHDKSHLAPRQTSRLKQLQSVQRRAQYRNPKIHDELTMKESISSENILGNGNFEIIKGGIFSEQDANEILGSRRISRGFGSYITPRNRLSQNQFIPVQNVQFPPFYQGRVQNAVHPMFYPRAPY